MLFRQFFDRESCTYSYLLADLRSRSAILIDPVRELLERDLKLLHELDLQLKYSIETHIHADHVTGMGGLRMETACIGVVPCHSQVQCADEEIQDNQVIELGDIQIKAIATPGHTSSHMAYLVNRTSLLTGDALFIRGCGRTDFQEGCPATLYESVTEKLFTLPQSTLVYPGHDYQGRMVSTIGEEKKWNPRFVDKSKAEFVELMEGLNLPLPKKIHEAVPLNMQCGLAVS